eukprot:comp20683_c1_seq1/m.26910 comp20683_c1_seq1/g.26910  ORF comp20683_c1_seq1/g.26910 comp20683_c1_seq1/m.26910 type:complete len:320 (-) comp20683_c1_seq1:316-1275(-)
MGYKVAVVGAAGGIGQPLSLLMKLNPNVSELALFDVAPLVAGVAADVSHINTPAKVTSGCGNDEIRNVLKGADVVIIPAGVPRKPGMTRDDLFNINAGIVYSIAEAVADACPKALVGIISNPVNSTVPIFNEVMKAKGAFDPKRVFGISTLDIVRADAFVSELKGLDVYKTNVPVIGGHSGNTIIPLLSQVPANFTEEEIKALTPRIQDAGTEVVKAKAGAGSATLSMAHAGAHFANALLRALSGEKDVVECTYVLSSVQPEVTYFSSPVLLGPNGAEEIRGYGKISAYEEELIKIAIPGLQENIKAGTDFVAKKLSGA